MTETSKEKRQPSLIQVNQVGYFPTGSKYAAFHLDMAEPVPWQLVDAQQVPRYTGETTVFGADAGSGDFVHQIDFSTFSEGGDGFTLQAAEQKSPPFAIGSGLYDTLKIEALRYFYLNRSGIELTSAYAGAWSRPSGHDSDAQAACFQGEDKHGNVWSGGDYILNAAGGWYDAGDYGKYVVNGGITLWTLHNLHERLPSVVADGVLGIPESGNGRADILDEARWELSFLLRMQVPDGRPGAGLVHHKIHRRQWDGLPALPPTVEDGRVLYPPTTAATLNLAAAAAQGSRSWAELDPPFAADCLAAAQKAWQAALAHPDRWHSSFDGGGDYGDDDLTDEFYWAAAELYLTTGHNVYADFLTQSPVAFQIRSGATAMTWDHTASLGTLSLLTVPNTLPQALLDQAKANVLQTADNYLAVIEKEGYRLPISLFEWGSNAFILNNMIIMGIAFDLSQDRKYVAGMVESMDYLLGRNPLGLSYITGFGTHAVQHPHHRFWANEPADGWPPPPPGVIAGGPNGNPIDPVAQAQNLAQQPPAKCFLDDVHSWSTNEVAINWNAPLAWVAAYLSHHYKTV